MEMISRTAFKNRFQPIEKSLELRPCTISALVHSNRPALLDLSYLGPIRC